MYNMTYRRPFALVLCLWILVVARPALAESGIPVRRQLALGVGGVNANGVGNALDGPGLRLSFEIARAKAFVGLLADAQTGLGHAHFMKDQSGSLLMLLGSTLTAPDLSFRPSFRFGAGRAEQHFTDERTVVYSAVMGLGLEVTYWDKDWFFGLDIDGRVFLIPMTHATGDTSSSWLLAEMSYYLMVGHKI